MLENLHKKKGQEGNLYLSSNFIPLYSLDFPLGRNEGVAENRLNYMPRQRYGLIPEQLTLNLVHMRYSLTKRPTDSTLRK